MTSSVGLPVADAGGSLTVDDGGTTLSIDDGGGSITVDGTVTSTPSVTGGGTEASAQRVTIASDSTGVLSVDDNGGSLTVDNGGTFAVQATLQAGSAAVGKLAANDGVDIGDVTINNASGGSAVNIQDGGNSITVDGTVAATQSGTWTVQPGNTANTTAWKVDASSVAVPVTDNSGSLTVDNGGTFAVQDSQVIADNAGFTDGTSKVFMGGYIYDEVAGTALTENDAAAARINVNRAQVGIVEDGSTRGRYATVTASNALKVDASGVAVPITDNSGSLTVDNGGTFAVQAAQSGTWTVQPGNTANTTAWKVDGSAVTQPVSYATTGSGNATGALRVELANNGTGNISTVAAVTAITNALPAGTNVIGKVQLNPATSGGSTLSSTISGASTNATNVKNSAGVVYSIDLSNANASARWFKMYNKASAPTVGTDTPVFRAMIPASGGRTISFPHGLTFGTGIAFALTTGAADSDTGSVAANELTVNLGYA